MAFLLKGARVVDPQLNLDAVLDVRIDGETISEVAATVAPQEGDTVIDAKGNITAKYEGKIPDADLEKLFKG